MLGSNNFFSLLFLMVASSAFAHELPTDGVFLDLSRAQIVDSKHDKSHATSTIAQLNSEVQNALGHAVGIVGDAANAIERAAQVTSARRKGFENSSEVFQCTAALPLRGYQTIGGISAITQLKHTWLKIGEQTYGMPQTLNHTYFGGESVIRRPDPFAAEGLFDVSCTPVLRPQEVDDQKFKQSLQCIAEKASVSSRFSPIRRLTLDYHAFKNNCEAAVNFITECAGGEVSQKPNLNVGGEFSQNFPVRMEYKSRRVRTLLRPLFEEVVIVKNIYEKEIKKNPKIQPEELLEKIEMPLWKMSSELRLAKQEISRLPDYHPEDWLGSWETALESVLSREKQLRVKGVKYIVEHIVNAIDNEFPEGEEMTIQEACHLFRSECGV